ncbi:MAG: hypothetical protein OES84_00575 [Kiritimatiellaceae bacterium]|nr:hypothetical protein [Kiritimatiellaceae bacterium]
MSRLQKNTITLLAVLLAGQATIAGILAEHMLLIDGSTGRGVAYDCYIGKTEVSVTDYALSGLAGEDAWTGLQSAANVTWDNEQKVTNGFDAFLALIMK